MTIRNNNLGGTDWAGEPLSNTDLNDTFDATILGTVPVGTVQAWLKSYTNTPTLPDWWVECNGQTLSDVDSPYNGQVIPDLNNPVRGGIKGRFLRGDTTSGTEQVDQNLAHTHSVDAGAFDTGGGFGTDSGGSSGSFNTNSSGGNEARPVSYTVVWIMRIK